MVSPATLANLEKKGDFRSYRPKEAATLLGIGTATLWRWCREREDFPRPIKLSPRCTVFDGAALLHWRDAQTVEAA